MVSLSMFLLNSSRNVLVGLVLKPAAGWQRWCLKFFCNISLMSNMQLWTRQNWFRICSNRKLGLSCMSASSIVRLTLTHLANNDEIVSPLTMARRMVCKCISTNVAPRNGIFSESKCHKTATPSHKPHKWRSWYVCSHYHSLMVFGWVKKS